MGVFHASRAHDCSLPSYDLFVYQCAGLIQMVNQIFPHCRAVCDERQLLKRDGSVSQTALLFPFSSWHSVEFV